MMMSGDNSKKHEIEIKSISKNEMKFILYNSNTALANALRRIMLSEVPTLAVDIVNVYENTSPFHDEFIAHRIGLIPIDSRNIKSYEFRERCKCKETCSRCTVQYIIEVKCNNANKIDVSHYDIEALDHEPNIPMPIPNDNKHNNIDKMDTAIPIVTLSKNQTLHMKLTATKGIGKMHAKWIPANVSYIIDHKIVINHQEVDKMPKEHKLIIANNLNPDCYILKEMDDDRDVELQLSENMSVVMAESCRDTLTELGYNKDIVKVIYDETRFHFKVESVGSMPPEQIVEMAIEILESKLKDLEPQIKASFYSIEEVAKQLKEQGVSLYGIQLDLE
ncbi:DNA-directed RNA polymerase II subunit RPB3, putative [Plasmodium vinckei]|uniref:DNA-directed RNA polymerase II subunit RPB3, putative n=1 Tax=Plasmodium vinckei TaxID=5860 RepID=A0A6V7SV43_PLAVN|nr:DNA-directed RNA polymerase II subunit RPB3, putative [Plasmodium vinckei]